MGVISIKALFDWKDVQTGMERVRGQAQRASAELDKSFSLGSLGRNFIGAFAGLKLAEVLVQPLKDGLAYMQRIVDASATLRDVQFQGFQSRNSPERNLIDQQKRYSEKTTDLARVNGQLSELPDFANSAYAQIAAKVSETMGLGGVPGSAAFQKNQFDALTEERTKIIVEMTQLGDNMAVLSRTIEESRRRLGNDRSGIFDQRRVARGELSQVEALQRAADRASQEYLTVLRKRGPGAEADTAYNALLQAQNALIPAEATAERFRVNGVLPQISSSSLAQLGGGGNVNVFGGRPGEGLGELREQTRLLREISITLTNGRTITDVAP